MPAATLSEILDAINDYSDYEELGSVSRAKSFITACRRFLALPNSQADQGSSMGYDHPTVAGLLQDARDFVAANDTSSSSTSRVRFFSFSNGFR